MEHRSTYRPKRYRPSNVCLFASHKTVTIEFTKPGGASVESAASIAVVEFTSDVDCGKHGGLIKFFSSGLTIVTGGAIVASAAGTLRTRELGWFF